MTPRQLNWLLGRNRTKDTSNGTHFLLISRYAEGAQVLERIQQEGNPVTLYIQEPIYRDAWDGLLPKTDNWRKALTANTIVLFDTTGLGKIADQLRASGFPVFGGSEFADQLESDRDFGIKFMEHCGIQVPETKSFTDYKSAKRFLDSVGDEKYVFKPSSGKQDIPTKLTYVPSSPEDMQTFLAFVMDRWGTKIDKFDFQKFVSGTAVSSELWCDGKHILYPGNHTVENKKFANDDLGPSTGCSGNIVWVEQNPFCSIMEEGIERCAQTMIGMNFIGQLDLNAIVNDDGLWGLEWTPRAGYDATPTLLAMIDGEVSKLLADCARGQADYDFPFSHPYGSAIRLTIPPYPIEPVPGKNTEEMEPNVGIPIQGIDQDNLDHYYFYEVKTKNDQLVHSGGTGLIFTAVDAGDDVEQIFETPMKLASQAEIPNKHYRTDLQDSLTKMYEDAVAHEGQSEDHD